VVLRAGQRRQTEEFEKVDGQFILDDRDIASDRLWRVRRKAQDIPRDRQDALLLPSEQHLAIFGDLVLALFRRRQIVRVDVLQSYKDGGNTGPFRLFP
jgi:hypothetical protein